MKHNKKNLIHALNNSVKELQQGIDMHRCLLRSALEGESDDNHLNSWPECYPTRTKEKALRDAIKEAIDVLEESRKAFKSKKLEVLRKKLTWVLADTQT